MLCLEADEDDIRRVLTADMFYRRQRKWPLIEIPEGQVMFPLGEREIAQSLDKETCAYHIYHNFPHLKTILKKHRGKIAVCGGLPATFLRSHLVSNQAADSIDADIFFYGVSAEEATQILIDCVATIVSETNARTTTTNLDLDQDYIKQIQIERRLHITNIIVRYSRGVPIFGKNTSTLYTRLYQFVHRIYPSLDSILGAFDLGHCMFAFDGEKMWTNPLGLWSGVNNIIILDTSRRSTSYEHRILKYLNRFNASLYMPGFDLDKLYRIISNRKEGRKHTMEKIVTLIKELGLRATKYRDIDEVIDKHFEFPEDEDHICFHRLRIGPHSAFRAVTTDRTKIKNLDSPEYLLKYSDYSHLKMYDTCVAQANNTVLRCNNLDGVVVAISYDHSTEKDRHSYDKVVADFKHLISDPEVECDLDLCRTNMEAHIYTVSLLNPNHRVKLYGEWLGELQRIVIPKGDNTVQENDESDFRLEWHNLKLNRQKVIDKAISILGDRVLQAQDNLRGIKWNTQSPHQQWTASLNPIVEHPSLYYGEYYKTFSVGIPVEIEIRLRLGRRQKGCVLATLNRDTFSLLLRYIIRYYM